MDSVNFAYKLWITDALNIPHCTPISSFKEDSYVFKNKMVRIIICCGILRKIDRDDSKYILTVDDGTGTIQCFYNIARIEAIKDKICQQYDNDMSNITITSNSTFNSDTSSDTTLMQLSSNHVDSISYPLMEWFHNEISQQVISSRNLYDIVQVSGYLFSFKDLRMLNLTSIRVLKNWSEYLDYLMEVCHLYKNIYDKL